LLLLLSSSSPQISSPSKSLELIPAAAMVGGC
jgi:hypothetical protein